LGLLATLRWLVSESRERCGIEVDLKVGDTGLEPVTSCV